MKFVMSSYIGGEKKQLSFASVVLWGRVSASVCSFPGLTDHLRLSTRLGA